MENREESGMVQLDTGMRILLTALFTLGAIFVGPALVIYMLPTVIAAARRTQHLATIAIANALVGWTVIGWIVMLVWVIWLATGTHLKAKPVNAS